MTTSPNKMSDRELRRQLVKSLSTAQVESVDNKGEAVIEIEADRLLHLIKQHREAYALGLIGKDKKVPESIFKYGDDDVRKYWDNLRAKLQGMVGRDDQSE